MTAIAPAPGRTGRASTATEIDTLHLCDLTTSYHPGGGGIRTYLHEKRRFLRDETRCRHTLIVPAERNFVERDGRLVTVGIASPVVPGCAPYRFLLDLRSVGEVLASLGPDLIEVGCPYLLPWIARAHGRLSGAAVVGFYHTDFPHAYAGIEVGRRLGRAAGAMAERVAATYARAVYRNLDLTLTASTLFERQLAGWGVERRALVPLGVDIGQFHPGRRSDAVRRALGAAAGEPILVFAGRLDHEKRVDILLDAFRRLPAEHRAVLVLSGSGPSGGKLREAARGGARIVVRPYEGDRDRFATLLASADVYVSAAPHETFGLSVLEAQASGLPVAGVHAGAMIERVPPDTGELAEPESAGALAAAMDRVLRGDRVAMGRAARRRVVAESTWDVTFDRLLEAYWHAMERRRHETVGR